MDLSTSLNPTALPPATGLLIMLLAAYVGIDMGQRAQQRGGAERLPWLLSAAAALAAGMGAAAVLGVTDLVTGLDAAFDLRWTVAAAITSCGLCLLGLRLAHIQAASSWQLTAAAATLGAAALLPQLMMLQALRLQPGMSWHPLHLPLAWLVSSACFAWGLYATRGADGSETSVPRHAAGALIIGTGVLSAQWLVIAATRLPAGLVPASPGDIGAGTLVTLGTVGAAELLLLMLLACAVERRLNGRLAQAQTELQAHAVRDELTGLPNRIGFEQTLAQLQRSLEPHGGKAALLLVALDGFKQVNEVFGHQCGDKLLQCVAARLSALHDPMTLARLGGDEFLLLLHGDQAGQDAAALATQIIADLSQPCVVEGRELGIGCSIGLALYPQHGTLAALMTNASVAMRTAKSSGGATYSVFDPRMIIDQRDQAELLRDLRLAQGRAQLELYYQPKIHAPSAQITGVEALLRWHHPTRGTISPNVFIPMAERSGLINALGAWVIDEACRQARAWRDQGLRMRVAVNLSAHQLRQRDLPQHIAAALKRHQINPDLLTCEITESVAMEDTDATLRFFHELDAVGVHIAIDDFGSGYSSLAYLRKLPAGELKIDRAFVLDLEHSEEARKIAAAVVQLAQALKLKVVAEGVETEEQYQILRQLGCDELQGFLFAKPMSAKALGLWAIADEGPRAIQFSESLFRETQSMAL